MMPNNDYLLALGKSYAVIISQVRSVWPSTAIEFPEDYPHPDKPETVVFLRSGDHLPVYIPVGDLFEKLANPQYGIPFVELGEGWGIAADNVAAVLPPPQVVYPEGVKPVLCLVLAADTNELMPSYLSEADLRKRFRPRAPGFFGEG